MPFVLAQDIGEGVIDNILISPALHRWWGAATVAAVLVTVVLVARHVARQEAEPFARLDSRAHEHDATNLLLLERASIAQATAR